MEKNKKTIEINVHTIEINVGIPISYGAPVSMEGSTKK